MCRISAIIDFNYNINYNIEQVIVSMRDTMSYGGPDDAGSFTEQCNDVNIAFGHRRLSIIDLSERGHQPMLSQDNEVVITFNGEIYNYEEIRDQLIQSGYIFTSQSDTETIIQAYLKWGINCVNKFIGMFSFLLYDKKKQHIYAVRDRAGVKPLYYYHFNNLILFGSELKSFHLHPGFIKSINANALALFLQFSCLPAPCSIFKNTFKVMPGHYLKIDLPKKTIDDFIYWDVNDVYKQPLLANVAMPEILAKTEELLISACNYRMVADVPVGVFLSGGYDSSLVTALLQKNNTDKIKTFTIGFHEAKFNEAPFAKKVAAHLGTDHTEYYCTQQDALDIIPLLPDIYDEPFGDSSAIASALVSKIAKPSVKVALSADGGDEIFGGYKKYSLMINLSRFLFLPGIINKTAGKILEYLNPHALLEYGAENNLVRITSKLSKILQSQNMAEMAYWFSIPYTKNQLKKLIATPFNIDKTNYTHIVQKNIANDEINAMMAIDYQTYLPDDILTKIDRATMSEGLEGREPLLDHRLVEWLAQIPGSMKIKDGSKKFILKEIVHKYVPKAIMQRPKMGFGVPVTLWFKDSLKPYFDLYLGEAALQKHNLFNTELIQKKKSSYFRGNEKLTSELWNLLMFQMWYEKWMD